MKSCPSSIPCRDWIKAQSFWPVLRESASHSTPSQAALELTSTRSRGSGGTCRKVPCPFVGFCCRWWPKGNAAGALGRVRGEAVGVKAGRDQCAYRLDAS